MRYFHEIQTSIWRIFYVLKEFWKSFATKIGIFWGYFLLFLNHETIFLLHEPLGCSIITSLGWMGNWPHSPFTLGMQFHCTFRAHVAKTMLGSWRSIFGRSHFERSEKWVLIWVTSVQIKNSDLQILFFRFLKCDLPKINLQCRLYMNLVLSDLIFVVCI